MSSAMCAPGSWSWPAFTISDDVQLADDPTKWSIEGTRYEKLDRHRGAMACARGSNTAGGGLCKLLAVRAHPQGYSATQAISAADNGIVQRSASITEIYRVASMVVSTFYLSMVLALVALRRFADSCPD